MKNLLTLSFMLISTVAIVAQKNLQNDSNTPLHLLQPEYKTPYGIASGEDVRKCIERVFQYIHANTPARIVDSKTNKTITDYRNLPPEAQLARGDFRIASYEWGVTYSALQIAAEATGDSRYSDYVKERFDFLSQIFIPARQAYYDNGTIDGQMLQFIKPKALDDAGAMCAAMIKAQMKDGSLKCKPLIDNYFNYIMYGEYRLSDGTLARNRPHQNTVWTDDMYMGIPAIAQMGRYASDNNNKFFSEAVKQVRLFSEKMFVPEKQLFRHGWVESSGDEHPSFFWGRANGWAMLAICDVLDVLPANYQGREDIMDILRSHVRGVVSLQGKDGFWHQLLDRNDSYLETSATAIFSYCIAHAINKGWIDAAAYAPAANLAWQAVSTKINDKGQVEGTCVGTGMAFDAAFYYHRPVNVYAAHGYGPVIMAGAEMIKLLNNYHPRMNDSAVQYYMERQNSLTPIFTYAGSRNPSNYIPGTKRTGNKPLIFTIGDSTVKCGGGNGEGGMWGWGSFLEILFDTAHINVENHALGGRSSRTYYTEGLWDKVLPAVRKGDFVIINFGHNDSSPINTGRARGSLKGTGEESQIFIMEDRGGKEEVFTFGHYLRIFIRQAKAKGATVILASLTPGNRWTDDGRIRRSDDTYGLWTKEAAEQENVYFIDLNNITADKLEALGKEKAAGLFVDGVHNTKDGAVMNVESIGEGLKKTDCELKKYLK